MPIAHYGPINSSLTWAQVQLRLRHTSISFAFWVFCCILSFFFRFSFLHFVICTDLLYLTLAFTFYFIFLLNFCVFFALLLLLLFSLFFLFLSLSLKLSPFYVFFLFSGILFTSSSSFFSFSLVLSLHFLFHFLFPFLFLLSSRTYLLNLTTNKLTLISSYFSVLSTNLKYNMGSSFWFKKAVKIISFH